MSAPPYMPLYVADYLGDTRHLSTEQHGAYLLLLMSMWRAGGNLPNDHAKLARMAGLTPARWTRIGPDVMALFDIDGETVGHGRVQKEIEKYSRTSEERRKASERSRAAKSLKDNEVGSAIAGANAVQLLTKPEPEPELTVSKATVSRREARRPSKRCPADWVPSESTIATLEAEGCTNGGLERAMAMMRDHEFSTARSDWDATFRNWVRKDHARNQPAHHDARYEARQANIARAFLAADGSSRLISDL